MRRSWKTFFVGWAVVLTAVNPASAGRGHFWRHCPPPSCYVECSPCVVIDACCGESTSELPTPADMPSTPAPSQPAPRTPTPAAPPLPAAPMPEDSIPPLPAEPAVEPPAAAPSAPVDDMPLPTDTPADEPAAPAETPAKPAEDVEDLFKDTDAKPADAPADTTPAKPADTTPAKPADDVEDLFKDTDEKKAATSEPAQEEPMDPAPSSEVEDLFSEPTDKPSTSASRNAKPTDVAKPAQEQSPVRLWTDNTGKYQVRARLLVVGDRYVRLLKETGKTTTVPFSRLSGSDLAFVQHQVSSELAGNF